MTASGDHTVATLSAGVKLGPYEIEHRIGHGGMGDVYRAIDSRLGRPVAIKLLAGATQGNPARLKRFEQEARAVGNLNHPNLVTLHDIGEHEGAPYLVTELLEGKTLRALVAQGPLPVDEALHVAAEVARGLAAAHRTNIIHRDIKPENVFVMQEGRIKILDFGIAKLAPDTRDSVDDAQPPDDTKMTSTGMVIGTPGYMAPEQLQGGVIDVRADVFAVGVLLHEMIAGRRPFASATGIEESYAILKNPAPPIEGLHNAVVRVIRRCLEKLPDARFQTASDLAFALESIDVAEARRESKIVHPAAASTTEKVPRTARSFVVPALVLGALAGMLAVGILFGRRGSSTTAWPSTVPTGPTFQRVTYEYAMVPGGRFLEGNRIIYSRRRETWQVVESQLDAPTARASLEGLVLDVSRRGELAYVSRRNAGTLRRSMMLGASAPRVVAEGVFEASWAPDDSLAIVRADGSQQVLEYPVGTPIARIDGHARFLRVSRDGERIAYALTTRSEARGKIVIVDRAGAQVTASREHESVFGLAWSPDDREVWFSTPTRTASANGIHAIDLEGEERLLLHLESFAELADVDRERILIAPFQLRARQFVVRRGEPPRDVSWYDGAVLQDLSSDGRTLAFVDGNSTDMQRHGYAAFARTGDEPPMPIGHAYRLAFLADASAVIALVGERAPLRRIPLGPGGPTELARGPIDRFDLDDSLEIGGGRVVVRAARAGEPMRLWIQNLDGGEPTPVGPPTLPPGRHPIGPDARWIAVANTGAGIRLISTSSEPDRVLEGPEREIPIQFARDGSALFAMSETAFPRIVTRVDLATGERSEWIRIASETPPTYFNIRFAAGDVYAYSLTTMTQDLYVVEPPRR